MCTRAPLSSAHMCTDGQSQPVESHVINSGMSKARSQQAEHYRHEAAIYLRVVMDVKSWTQKDLAKAAGADSHSTVGRWLNKKTRPDYAAITAIEQRTGIPIPPSLKAAVIAEREHEGVPAPKSDFGGMLSEFERLSPEDQAAFIKQAMANKRRA